LFGRFILQPCCSVALLDDQKLMLNKFSRQYDFYGYVFLKYRFEKGGQRAVS